MMDQDPQTRAPIYEALERRKRRRVVPFDVPGHKRGRGNPELVELLGEKCVSMDVNSMKPLDNLCHPVSVLNALVLCGAVPVYVNPEVDKRLGISLGMEPSEVQRAIQENPGAVAVLVNNPTYYGICSDLRAIVELAHRHEMLVLVDEAHGTHLYFGEGLPACAMDVGADMASVCARLQAGSDGCGI